MRAEIKERWLNALRSGEYKQGRQRLRCGDEYCCLGVLCDLHAKEGRGEWTRDQHDPMFPDTYRYRLHTARMPLDVEAWAGISHETGGPHVNWQGSRWLLEQLNDTGKSFDEIADLIEQQL